MTAKPAEILRAHIRRLEKLKHATGADAWLFASREGTLRTPAFARFGFDLLHRMQPHGAHARAIVIAFSSAFVTEVSALAARSWFVGSGAACKPLHP